MKRGADQISRADEADDEEDLGAKRTRRMAENRSQLQGLGFVPTDAEKAAKEAKKVAAREKRKKRAEEIRNERLKKAAEAEKRPTRAAAENPEHPSLSETVLAKGGTASKKAPAAPKKSTFNDFDGDQEAYEAMKEKELEAKAGAYPDTGMGAKGGKARARQAKTAAKVMKDFAEHKAAKLAARATGAHWRSTRINFQQFLNKLRVRGTDRPSVAKAAKVLKKSVVEKLK